MKYQYLIIIIVCYGLLGAAGYVLVRTIAVGAADAGVAGPTGLRLLGLIVDYILLQPIALWVVEGLAVRWWTPAGAAALVAVSVLNSALVCSVVYGLVRSTRAGIGRVSP